MKDVKPYQLRKSVLNNENIYMKTFPGATIEDLREYVRPSLRHNPDLVILHTGTNDLRTKLQSSQIVDQIMKLELNIKCEENEVAISSIITRNDDLNANAIQVNDILKLKCSEYNLRFIEHENIKSTHLNNSSIHTVLAKNILNVIKQRNIRYSCNYQRCVSDRVNSATSLTVMERKMILLSNNAEITPLGQRSLLGLDLVAEVTPLCPLTFTFTPFPCVASCLNCTEVNPDTGLSNQNTMDNSIIRVNDEISVVYDNIIDDGLLYAHNTIMDEYNRIVDTDDGISHNNLSIALEENDMYDNDVNDSTNASLFNTENAENPLLKLKEYEAKNYGKLIIGHLNINALSNKFEGLKMLVQDTADFIIISETKLDDSFPCKSI